MTAVVLWVVRILIVLIVVRYVVRALGGRPAVGRQAPRIGGALVRDPQCGTYLPPDRAVTLAERGRTLHFCSNRCRDDWKGAAARASAR